MRLVRFETPAGVQVGRIESDDTVVPIAGTVLDNARRATREPGWVAPATGHPLPLADLTLEAPVERPGSLRDFYAFERHVDTARAGRGLETGPRLVRAPRLLLLQPRRTARRGCRLATHPRTQGLDFELELAWLVGWDVAGADEDAAAPAIVGYTVMNDWSARDVQREEMALNLGPAKGKDFAGYDRLRGGGHGCPCRRRLRHGHVRDGLHPRAVAHP